MQFFLQVSRKVDYALRAMVYLASLPPGVREPFRTVAANNLIPRDFLAKILKALSDQGLVTSVRGPGGGVCIAKDPAEVSFLDVIEAVEGPVTLNVCLSEDTEACAIAPYCSMKSVWRRGQERMLDVYRSTMLSDLVGKHPLPVRMGSPSDKKPLPNAKESKKPATDDGLQGSA